MLLSLTGASESRCQDSIFDSPLAKVTAQPDVSTNARVAELALRRVANAEVAGSTPVSRSSPLRFRRRFGGWDMGAVKGIGGIEEIRRELGRLAAVLAPEIEAVSVATAVERTLAAKRLRGLRDTYLKSFGSTLAIFAGSLGGRIVDEVKSSDIEHWLCSSPWNCETRRGYLKNVRTFFSFAVKRGWCRKNVALDVEWPAPSNEPPGILTVDQCRTIMRVAQREQPGLVHWLSVQLFAGLRVNEAISLAPAQVNGHVEILAAKCKTRKRRLVDFNPALKAWVPGAYEPPTWWRVRLERLKAKCGFEWPRNCLRHSFVSYALPVHGASQVALWAGHSEAVLFQHYRELVTKEQAEAFWNIRPESAQMELGF